jgi:hypothetical protein
MYPNDTRVAINEYLIDKIMTPQVEALKESYYLPKYDQFIKQLEGCMKKDGFSVTWSMGGTYGSYTGSIHETSGELEPPFSALDEFLLENFPNMGFLQYKYLEGKIQRYTDDERDYYGGSVTHG